MMDCFWGLSGIFHGMVDLGLYFSSAQSSSDAMSSAWLTLALILTLSLPLVREVWLEVKEWKKDCENIFISVVFLTFFSVLFHWVYVNIVYIVGFVGVGLLVVFSLFFEPSGVALCQVGIFENTMVVDGGGFSIVPRKHGIKVGACSE